MKGRILLVEDDAGIATVVRTALEDEGVWTTVDAASGVLSVTAAALPPSGVCSNATSASPARMHWTPGGQRESAVTPT